MTHEHIDELAELYALGVLDDLERAAVETHVQTCAECAKRLGEAEMLIADTVVEREPSPQLDARMRKTFAARRTFAPRWGALVAAAFLVGLLPGLILATLERRPSAFDQDRDAAIGALINSHFTHAQFTALAPDAPKAKVIYAHGKAWRYFVAQTNHAYTVESQAGGKTQVLGTLHVSGNAAELYVPDANARSFVLSDGTRVVAKVRLP